MLFTTAPMAGPPPHILHPGVLPGNNCPKDLVKPLVDFAVHLGTCVATRGIPKGRYEDNDVLLNPNPNSKPLSLTEKLPDDLLEIVLEHATVKGLELALKQTCTAFKKCMPTQTSKRAFDPNVVQSVVLLTWARENGCAWYASICAAAAKGGHLDCLKYAHEHGCPWDERTCAEAAKEGHLDCLKYAHEHGCPWDGHTLFNALGGHAFVNGLRCERFESHVDCFKYAYNNGCSWDDTTSFWNVFGTEMRQRILAGYGLYVHD
uniref:F-box domain-containing protein n=1 Tax=viral metagenome TaxID=1070528 RepID=A0A6C0IYQ2_9ZZZZ